jgi:hypothetical protein
MPKQTIFEIKKEHLMLLKNMYVGWSNCEYGAPEIDPKRPFGNSDVIGDMIEIFKPFEVQDGLFKLTLLGEEYYLVGHNKKLHEVLDRLYRETQTVLQIALNTLQFKTGKYRLKDEYGADWEYIGE